jgi:2-oxoglutarate ferredoxin oxidoreductase subunit alpha
MQSVSSVLARLLSRNGYHVFANQDIMSRIRGGHNFSQVRVSTERLDSPAAQVNLLVALDPSLAELHFSDMVADGVAVFDPGEPAAATGGPLGMSLFPVPLASLARAAGKDPVMTGTVALGVVMSLTGYPLDPLLAVLGKTFSAKGEKVVAANLACARAGHEYAARTFALTCPCQIELQPQPTPRLLLTGNEAIAAGAVAAGLKFFSGYPMSPSTPIMEFVAARAAQLGIVLEQSEDEIAGIGMALGASYAGARTMTATSGGGFALMIENLGLAGMSETPVVIALCQRPGPATGFPTRTEQADLLFALYAGQDEFPRFIFAPGNAEQAFALTARAFDLADKYQVPAIVLSDQLLSDSQFTPDRLPEPEGRKKAELKSSRDEEPGGSGARYRRYLLSNPVSPRLFPGTRGQVVVAAGHEHDEDGYIEESAANRNRMTEKRLVKADLMREEVDGLTAWPEDPDEAMLVCFGSTLGAVTEATARLRQEQQRVSMLHLSMLAPFPRELVSAACARSRRVFTVENNATAQLAHLLHAETRIRVEDSVLKYDGRPFTATEIAGALREKL